MERGMFGILVLSGLFHCVFSYLHSRYNFINTPKTWSEARKYCREKYIDLATITEERDLVELAALTEPGVQLVFIGLHRAWGWSYPGAEVYSQRELTYLNWASGEPKQNFHYCAGMGKDGTWVSANCSTRMNFFCYEGIFIEQLLSFAESETRVTERFILKREFLSWADAQQSCRKHHTDLAKVRDMIDNNILHMMIGGGPVWFGLTDVFWVWSDGIKWIL
ncbi:putative C-type lectin domain family 20 member A [Plectropomus leopardus]|uniref:putative C-type lectin domain family 20 member A n=1 Tax=Plectropomus leopardus TaxID=160734 RepID=UPI001C4AE6C0|nr:putative C-type lectin domain family 20 member A [Plectropomus leopardus]